MEWTFFDTQGGLTRGAPVEFRFVANKAGCKSREFDYLLINSGFAAARKIGDAVLLRFRPSHVTERAFFGVLMFCQEQGPARLVAETFADGCWSSRIFGNAAGAGVPALLRVFRAAQPDMQEKIKVRSRSPSSLPARSQIRNALQFWVATGGKQGPVDLFAFASVELNGSYTIIKSTGGERRLTVCSYGDGVPLCARIWLGAQQDGDFTDQPDRVYGAHCGDVYRHAARNGTPSIADVDAFVAWPGFGMSRRRYRRLLLPFDSGRDTTFVLGVTVSDPSIDLRSNVL